MQAIYFLIPIAILVTLSAIAVFFWAVKSEQFSDLDSPSQKIILDDMHDYNNRNHPNKKNKNT